jgi:hypothetical protein
MCRSTPRVDTFWGGKNDLTAAMGYEKDGITTILFRKKLKGMYYCVQKYFSLHTDKLVLQNIMSCPAAASN